MYEHGPQKIYLTSNPIFPFDNHSFIPAVIRIVAPASWRSRASSSCSRSNALRCDQPFVGASCGAPVDVLAVPEPPVGASCGALVDVLAMPEPLLLPHEQSGTAITAISSR